MTKKSIFQGQNFRWVVPQLPAEIWDRKEAFKTDLLDRLRLSKTAKKRVKYYSIAIQSHADGNPHLDMLIIFQKNIRITTIQLDFLCQKHGNLTRYRTLNTAILDYGSKEDTPLSNVQNVQYILNKQEIKTDAYAFLQERMLRDPFGFDLAQYCAENDYFASIQRWPYIKNKLRDHQEAICNKLLRSKPGIRFIDDDLIRSTLTTSQQLLYHSWSGYQQIVDFLNQIPTLGFERPFKTPNLLLVGPPNVGKTSLILEIDKYTSVYPVGTQNWFPKFKNLTYKLIFWDEWFPSMMPWESILMLFQGLPMDLPYKGGSILKRDNQLWIMTHNETLAYQVTKIRQYMGHECVDRSIAVLRARLTQIIIPANKPLFILQKLIISL